MKSLRNSAEIDSRKDVTNINVFGTREGRLMRTCKQPEKIYPNVMVHWLEYKGQWSPPVKLHCEGCTIIDKGGKQVQVIFPEGDVMRKYKTTPGFRLDFVKATKFLASPNKGTIK